MKPTKTILMESDAGVSYRVTNLTNALFNFYILKGKEYKDRTNQWKICVELASNPKRSITLATIRGHKATAVRRLDEILKNGL